METVVECKQIKTWNNKPIYGIGLSDGRGGESFQNIPVGTPVGELNMETSQYGLRIKWNKPGGSGGFQRGSRGGNESFALSYSKDIVCAGKAPLSDLLTMADKMLIWLDSKKQAQQQTAHAVVKTVQSTPPQQNSPEIPSDFPF